MSGIRRCLSTFQYLYFPDKHIQRLGNFNQLMTADNVNIIFWGVGNVLAVNMVSKPLGGYSQGRAAILNEYAVITLNPG